MKRRVVVTGIGLVTPIGNDACSSFASLQKGQSGIAIVESWINKKWKDQNLPVLIGGEVKNFDPDPYLLSPKEKRRSDRLILLGLAAGVQAWQMAGLPESLEETIAQKAGCLIGVGLIGINYFLDMNDTLNEKGPNRISPFLIPAIISNLVPGQLAQRFNLKAANFATTSACASGSHAIGEAMRFIQNGTADIMLAGGAESALHPLAVIGFHAMTALCASKNHDPTRASRPFDRERDGFVMGEGAGILVLEELEHAKKRGANILAELVGYGVTCDAYHITAPSPDGEGAMRAMQEALKSAGADKSDVDYINAHGTSTPLNDKVETQAIKNTFQDHAHKLMVSSNKSMIGHLLGAAGGVEAGFSVLSLMHGIVPPTINYENPDPDCDLDYVPNEARQAKLKMVMSNSFGFGGTNAVLLFKSFQG